MITFISIVLHLVAAVLMGAVGLGIGGGKPPSWLRAYLVLFVAVFLSASGLQVFK